MQYFCLVIKEPVCFITVLGTAWLYIQWRTHELKIKCTILAD
jgi:hypothetical protein